MGFSERLKQLRREHKLTQEQLGKRINVTKVSVSGYENGNRTPDIETLQKLADVFDVSIDYLLDRTDEIPKETTEEMSFTKEEKENLKKLVEIYRKMSPEGKEAMIKQAQLQAELMARIQKQESRS